MKLDTAAGVDVEIKVLTRKVVEGLDRCVPEFWPRSSG